MLKLDSEGDAKESFLTKYLRVTGVVALYWSVSITLVFTNKYLLNSDELKLDAPFFVTWSQCVVTCVMTYISAKFGLFGVSRDMNFDATTTRLKCKQVLPLSIAFVSMITFNNLTLGKVGVAFYTIARSQSIVFSLLFMWMILGKKTSFAACCCCGIVVSGFLLGVSKEGDLGSLSVIGTIFGVIASACAALNSIYTKKVMPYVDGDIWAMAYYNNVNACWLFLPLIIISDVKELLHFPLLFSMKFWGAMSAAGFMGFCMGYVVGLEIKVTTPVTHSISGIAKACLQTVIATVYFSTPKPWMWWLSNLLVLGGTMSYSFVKTYEMRLAQSEVAAKNDSSDKTPLLPK